MSPLMWRVTGIATIGVMLISTYLFGVSPRLAEISANNAQLQLTQKQAQAQQVILENLVIQSRDKSTLEKKVNALQQAVPDELEAATFVTELNGLATAHGVSVASLKFTDPLKYQAPTQVKSDSKLKAALSLFPEGSLYVFDIDMSATGSLSNLVQFIEAIQKGNRTVLVNKVAVNAGANSADYTLKLGAQAFIFTSAASN